MTPAEDSTSADEAKLRRGVAWNLVPVVVLGVVGLGLNFAIGRWWGTSALGVFNQVTTAYQDISNTFDPGGRIGQLMFRVNW